METAVALSDPRDRKRYYFHPTWFRRAFVSILRLVFRLFTRIEVSGLENLPAGGPVVLACNHATNFDVFPMQLALPRTIFFMGKEELYRNLLSDWFFRQMGSFPVYRGERDAWAIRHACEVLEHGQVLGIFPEGSRNKGQGLRKGKSGAARIAMDCGCPIVPMSIDGTQRIFSAFPSRTRVKISLGAPILPEPGELPLSLTNRTMQAIAATLPDELRGAYAGA